MTDTKSKVNIFISHKHEDEQTAMCIRDILKALDDPEFPRINFFLSEEILGGEDWYKWIKNRLVETNLLLLLFTDHSRSWDWCLYEAGLFDRMDEAHMRRIICLHSRNTDPPNPLKHLQAFSAEPNRLRRFLEQLFIGTELLGVTTPLASWLKMVPERLDADAKKISQLIDRVPVETKYFNKYLFIEIREPDCLTPTSIPHDAVVNATENTFAIFDKQAGPWTWKDIEEKARQNQDQRWLDELANAIYASAKGDIPKPIHAIFHSLKDARMYSLILYRSDRMANGGFTFKVLLHEDIAWQLEDVPAPMRSLATSLLMATRFRYELIEKYRDKLGKGYSAAALKRSCTEIRQVVIQIESEAESRGLLERYNLVSTFYDAERDEVDEMYDTWYEIREQLLKGVETQDRDTIHRSLQELAVINRRYLEIALRRYHEMMVGDFHKLDRAEGMKTDCDLPC